VSLTNALAEMSRYTLKIPWIGIFVHEQLYLSHRTVN
jgi:hypothetical protein